MSADGGVQGLHIICNTLPHDELQTSDDDQDRCGSRGHEEVLAVDGVAVWEVGGGFTSKYISWDRPEAMHVLIITEQLIWNRYEQGGEQEVLAL
jgi:hypothetical protein